MLKNSKFSIWFALMLPVIFMGAFHPAGALAQCGGGDHQSMHEQHMGSYGQMGMGSGQMGMNNAQAPAQADPNATAPGYVALGSTAPQETSGSGQMTGMDHSGHQY